MSFCLHSVYFSVQMTPVLRAVEMAWSTTRALDWDREEGGSGVEEVYFILNLRYFVF